MGAVNTTYTFTATDTITSAKMNNIIDQTTITSDAIFGTTLEVASGKLKVRAQGITSNELTANSVTSTNIVDGSITPVKLSTAGPFWDNAGGTFTLSQRGIEVGTGITSNTESYIDFHSSFPVTDYDCRMMRNSGVDGIFEIYNTGAGVIKLTASSGVTFGSANMPNPVGTAPIYGARAWAKLNPYIGSVRTGAYKTGTYSRTATETSVAIVSHGLKANDKIRLDFTTGTGTDGLYTVISSSDANNFVINHTGTVTSGNVTAQFIAIQGSGNISSASWYDASDDRIVLNFAIPMPNANYVVSATGQYFPSGFYGLANEDTLGDTQLNTINQAHVAIADAQRFTNVVIFG